jgi:hypothetical protein
MDGGRRIPKRAIAWPEWVILDVLGSGRVRLGVEGTGLSLTSQQQWEQSVVPGDDGAAYG